MRRRTRGTNNLTLGMRGNKDAENSQSAKGEKSQKKIKGTEKDGSTGLKNEQTVRCGQKYA